MILFLVPGTGEGICTGAKKDCTCKLDLMRTTIRTYGHGPLHMVFLISFFSCKL